MWLCNDIISCVSEWKILSMGPEWQEFDYAGPIPIFFREAVVVAQLGCNRARLASERPPCTSIYLLWE